MPAGGEHWDLVRAVTKRAHARRRSRARRPRSVTFERSRPQADFDCSTTIAKGSFGTVFKAVRKSEPMGRRVQADGWRLRAREQATAACVRLTRRDPLAAAGDGRVFALKQVPLKGMSRVDREEAVDEARMLAQLAHPHVTRHYSSFIGAPPRARSTVPAVP
jgi:serine/threonine protein kinase